MLIIRINKILTQTDLLHISCLNGAFDQGVRPGRSTGAFDRGMEQMILYNDNDSMKLASLHDVFSDILISTFL